MKEPLWVLLLTISFLCVNTPGVGCNSCPPQAPAPQNSLFAQDLIIALSWSARGWQGFGDALLLSSSGCLWSRAHAAKLISEVGKKKRGLMHKIKNIKNKKGLMHKIAAFDPSLRLAADKSMGLTALHCYPEIHGWGLLRETPVWLFPWVPGASPDIYGTRVHLFPPR